MAAGKDYFTDKAPLTTLKQLEAAKEMVKRQVRSTCAIIVSVYMLKLLCLLEVVKENNWTRDSSTGYGTAQRKSRKSSRLVLR